MPDPSDEEPIKRTRKRTTASKRKPAAPKTGVKAKPSPLLTVFTAVYALVLLLLWFSHWVGPETWWPFGINMYVPQWIYALPLIILLPWQLARNPRRLWIPLALALLVFGPLMGLCWRFWNRVPSGKGTRLRVLTYNIKWGRTDMKAIEQELDNDKPDIVLMQDAGGAINSDLGRYFKDWNVVTTDQFIIASRLPLSNPDVRWISYPDHSHRVFRCNLRLGAQTVTVYDCHLVSPRWGLVALKHPRSGIAGLENNLNMRLVQARLLADHVHSEHGPVLLTGDLNAPVQSLVLKKLFSVGLQDAFETAGGGYGYSYGQTTKVGIPYVRIDHIMTSPEWQILGCWVGNDIGSDHSPVIADLFLPAPPQ